MYRWLLSGVVGVQAVEKFPTQSHTRFRRVRHGFLLLSSSRSTCQYKISIDCFIFFFLFSITRVASRFGFLLFYLLQRFTPPRTITHGEKSALLSFPINVGVVVALVRRFLTKKKLSFMDAKGLTSCRPSFPICTSISSIHPTYWGK